MIWSFAEWFLEIHLCVVEFGIKKYVLIFKVVAGVSREFIWELIFCLCNNFLLLSGNFRCVFLSLLKSIRCVYWKLILKFVDDGSDM